MPMNTNLNNDIRSTTTSQWNVFGQNHASPNQDQNRKRVRREGRNVVAAATATAASTPTSTSSSTRHRDHRDDVVDTDMPTLAQELNNLTVQERNQVYEDIHGVADVIPETPEMVTRHIQELKNCLEQMKNEEHPRGQHRQRQHHHHQQQQKQHQRADLDKAFFLRPALQDDEAFYLMFLRARRFNAVQAAECMCAYFTNKIALFGEELLVEKITLDHLHHAELAHIRKGSYQFLRNRESTGRTIAILTMSEWDISDWKSYCRYLWYAFMSVIEEDIETQKRGVVVIHCYHGFKFTSDVLKFPKRIEAFNKQWPVHLNVTHRCYDNLAFNAVLQGAVALLPKHWRVRQKLHYGSILEVKHALMSFGIDVHDCFESGIGPMSPEAIQAFIDERVQVEASWRQSEADAIAKVSFIFHPKPFDVIMGRLWLRYVKCWPGNVAFHQMVNATVPKYSAADRQGKTIVTLDVVRQMYLAHGSRFLEPSNDGKGWIEVNEDVARVKVSQAIRAIVRRKDIGSS